MPETPDAPRRLTVRKAADIAQVDASTVRKWVRRGRLPAVQREPQILVDREALDQFLRQRTPPAQVVSTTSKDEGQDADIRQGMPAIAFSRNDAARLLGVHPDTVNRWRRQGRLQATPEGLVSLAEIERLTAETAPTSDPQLELLSGLAPSVPPTAREATPALTPSWTVLVRLLEASYQREAKLAEQLDVVNTLLLRLVDPTSPRPAALSGHGDPLTPPLTERVLAFLREHPGPHRGVEVRDALGLPHSPKNTLQSLFQRKLIERLAPGVFQAIPDDKPISPLEPAEGTLLARVLAYVRETTGDNSRRRGVRSWQVQKALDLSQSTNRTLTRLVERKLIYRIGKGLYSARPLEVDEEQDITQQVTEEGSK